MMSKFSNNISLRWSDIDPNLHVRHSAYYDFGAQIRADTLNSLGITLKLMLEESIGFVLLREECIFRREIRYGDNVSIDIKLSRLYKDYSRFSFQHELKKSDGTFCALINVEAAWINTKMRKLTPPPQTAINALNQIPKADNFEWLD